MSVALRPFLPADGPALARLFRASVEALTQDDYSERQRAAWAAAADDLDVFVARLAGALTLIATSEGELAGFAALEGEKITMLFVHPEHCRKGVGRALAEAIEKLAAARKVKILEADASDAARDFFQKRGYDAFQRNSVMMGDEWLANTTMKKKF